MEVLICGGCKGTVPEVLPSPRWHPARVLSILDAGDGLGGDLSIQRAVTGVQQGVLGLQLHVGGWHGVGCHAGSQGQLGSPCCDAPEHV